MVTAFMSGSLVVDWKWDFEGENKISPQIINYFVYSEMSRLVLM
jgi:hypothetical protein